MIEYQDWKSEAVDASAPDFVKKADFSGDCWPRSGYFADTVHDELPCNTAAETWVSARCFAKKAAAGSYSSVRGLREDISGRILRAAGIFGVSDSVKSAMEYTQEVKKASDSDYGWVDASGRKYPMFDERGVKLAVAYFEENKFKYPFSMRNTIAKNIISKCAEFGVDVPDGIRKTAGHGLARPDNVINELVVRAEACSDNDAAIAMASMAEKVAELGMDALSDGAAEKIAELVEDADVVSGLHGEYGRTVMAPEDFLFDIDIKTAEAAVADSVEVGGDVLSLRKLAKLPDDMFDGVFGDGFSESCKTAGAIDPAKLGAAISARPVEDVNELAAVLRSL